MVRNILLTSLSNAENDLPIRYFSVRKEFGFDYCDALLDTEAGIKAMLARYDIDEIIVSGGSGSYREEDDLKPVSLRHGSSMYSMDRTAFSTYGLLQYRIAQYADELPSDRDKENGLVPKEMQDKLLSFILDYKEQNAELKTKKINRLFDVFSQDDRIYEEFRNALFDAFPELRDHPGRFMQWVRSYLYSELKPTAKLELPPVNEEARICLIPENRIEESGQWADSLVSMQKSIVGDEEEINLYITLNSDDAADSFIVINMLDMLISMPGSNVHLKKIFTVRSLPGRMSGIIRDDTEGFGVTEVFHAIRAFLNYGKADMITDIWEKSGERNESIAGMIYAMRHVDVGLSMCNITEVEGGILRLRKLFRDEAFLQEAGHYGMLFSMIAESIRKDYGALLEGSGDIPFIELVKWAYRHQFYQQVLTLIEAKAPGNIVRSGVFYYCGDENLEEQVTQLFAKQRLTLKSYEYYKMDNIDHYFIKTYDRSRTKGLGGRDEDPQRVYAALRTKSVENKDPSLITGLTACDSMETLQDLLFAYYHIGMVRNKISHAESEAMTENRLIVSESDESPALVWTKDSIDFFIAAYEKAMSEVQNKKPDIVLITGERVRAAAEHLK